MELDGAEIWTGVSSIEKKEIVVYPNPGTGIYTVQVPPGASQELDIRIFDLSGKIVYQKRYDYAEDISFDISGRAPGIYIIQGVNSERIFTQKIIHQLNR